MNTLSATPHLNPLPVLAEMPALSGALLGLVIFAGLVGVVFGLFYVINQMR